MSDSMIPSLGEAEELRKELTDTDNKALLQERRDAEAITLRLVSVA